MKTFMKESVKYLGYQKREESIVNNLSFKAQQIG